MEIRTADWSDIQNCLAVDDSFETEYVWQMDERSQSGQITINFKLARLPRPTRVHHVVSGDQLIQNVQDGGQLFVADDGGIRGYVDVSLDDTNQTAEIHNMVIAPLYRRKGVGTRLVRAVLVWARNEKMRTALLDTSTKNHPAICFFQKQGFRFCGYNDQHMPTKDIAMFFSINLR